MAHLARTEPMLRQLNGIAQQLHICHACRAQALRQYHASRIVAAEKSTLVQRLRDATNIFRRDRSPKAIDKKETPEPEVKQEAATVTAPEKKERVAALHLSKEEIKEKRIQRKLKDRGYKFLDSVDSTAEEGYVPARDSNGLASIGSEQWARAQNDRGEPYEGYFLHDRPRLGDNQWIRLLHHVTVEVLALQRAGRDLKDICLSELPSTTRFKQTVRSKITINKERNGARLDDVDVKKFVGDINAVEVEKGKVNRAVFTQKEAVRLLGLTPPPDFAGMPKARLPGWMAMRLHDQHVKFMIVKRTMQLSGHRIPDHAISNASTLEDLYAAFRTKEKPTKLSKSSQIQTLKRTMPNVTVYGRKRSVAQEEQDVGRWKLIKNEFLTRDIMREKSLEKSAKAEDRSVAMGR